MNRSDHPFRTTSWTLVWNAATPKGDIADSAMEELAQQYWLPLYGYARRLGWSREDAEDATQEFVSRMLVGDWLENADPARGRFRTFLLTAWKRFLVSEYRKQHAAKRGGHRISFSLDANTAEAWLECALPPTDPDLGFHADWASQILDCVDQKLTSEYAERGRSAILEDLLPVLVSSLRQDDYQRIGEKLQMSATATKVALHRLRNRYRELLLEQVASTVEDPAEIHEELSELLLAFQNRTRPRREPPG